MRIKIPTALFNCNLITPIEIMSSYAIKVKAQIPIIDVFFAAVGAFDSSLDGTQ